MPGVVCVAFGPAPAVSLLSPTRLPLPLGLSPRTDFPMHPLLSQAAAAERRGTRLYAFGSALSDTPDHSIWPACIYRIPSSPRAVRRQSMRSNGRYRCHCSYRCPCRCCPRCCCHGGCRCHRRYRYQ